MRALICPIILHDKSVFYATQMPSRMDKSLSVGLAVFIHLIVLGVVGALFFKPVQFGVDKGIGGIEVDLVAAPTESVPQMVVPPEPVAKSAFVEKIVVKSVVKPVEKQTFSKTVGKDKVTVKSTGGAISEAKPDYLRNPAPEYPELARRRGYEGTVILKADIDREGAPVAVTVEKSSGHSLLDEAALKAVRTWKFYPGKLGNIPVESMVRVPVRFYLKEN